MHALFRVKLIQTSGHKMAALTGLSLKHQFLTNGMRNEVNEKCCVYFIPFLLIVPVMLLLFGSL